MNCDWEEPARKAGANVSESLMVQLIPEAEDFAKYQDWAKVFLADALIKKD